MLQLKQELNNMEERVAEGELWRMDIDDKINTLRRSLCAKVKRITEAMGRPELYDPPMPEAP